MHNCISLMTGVFIDKPLRRNHSTSHAGATGGLDGPTFLARRTDMGVLGLSLLVASVVYFCMFPQPWLKYFLRRLPPIDRPPEPPGDAEKKSPSPGHRGEVGAANEDASMETTAAGVARDRASMPPPPLPPPSRQQDGQPTARVDDGEEQMTPKVRPSTHDDAVPTFSLSSSDVEEPNSIPVFPAPFSAQRARASPAPGSMAPPPRPPTLAPLPTSGTLPPLNRTLPIPNRGRPAASSSSLAPPPTHSTKPAKPSRQVVLTPGHSPLDWAYISGPSADLRNLPPQTPYLRVTPTMLRGMTGRRGKDAWTVLGGKVYNITPYLPFHPGGEPELLRCAGRDGNKLFGEIHPWVNYDTMLAACLVGILVDEHDRGNSMEEMD